MKIILLVLFNLEFGLAIINGKVAMDFETWKFIVSLHKLEPNGDWGYFCTGSAITEDFAVTAKHCIHDMEVYNVKLQSECSTSSLSEFCFHHFPSKFVLHSSKSVDLALVKVGSRPFGYIAILPPSDNMKLHTWTICRSASWGITDYNDLKSYSQDLIEMDTRIEKKEKHEIWTNDMDGEAVSLYVRQNHSPLGCHLFIQTFL